MDTRASFGSSTSRWQGTGPQVNAWPGVGGVRTGPDRARPPGLALPTNATPHRHRSVAPAANGLRGPPSGDVWRCRGRWRQPGGVSSAQARGTTGPARIADRLKRQSGPRRRVPDFAVVTKRSSCVVHGERPDLTPAGRSASLRAREQRGRGPSVSFERIGIDRW